MVGAREPSAATNVPAKDDAVGVAGEDGLPVRREDSVPKSRAEP